ncbi:coiled-coil domain-containing protein 34 [Myripristis murdjan]|uniref:Coiled-coil domain containing 34 n=1 Tax=Myripristis murdjan TaxID=586833 RepID=A0A667XP07_9TELE|nr:coiled-coil domain-containing protein 34 [Myripristis murdjan]XP_029908942.1 coiled-coil domain-containing protein 34 [Myripristis murdjan]
MSEGRLPSCPASASTPVKHGGGAQLHTAGRLQEEECVSSDDDTFSLLSPIYHDSFESDEEPDSAAQSRPQSHTSPSPSASASRQSISPVRCELPKARTEQLVPAAGKPTASPPLSAWELWLVNKAKDDRLRLEKKEEAERLLKEKKEQEEREKNQRKIVIEERIQEWLKIKSEHEKQEKLLKESREKEETQRQLVKQRETEHKAQEKYKEWLRKKNQEKMDKERKDKEETVRREEQGKERRKQAEEKFKEWLAKSNDKKREDSSKTPCYPRSPYDRDYPSPSFYNPIPWKPIHVPTPESQPQKTPHRNQQKHRKYQQRPKTALSLRNSVSATQMLQRR